MGRDLHHGRPTLRELATGQLSRRTLLQAGLAGAALGVLSPTWPTRAGEAEGAFSFEEAPAGVSERHAVAPGYDVSVLLRWGDPIFPDSPPFDPHQQTVAAQERQFGYDNDYVGYLPLDGASDHGILVVNHENANTQLMFPGVVSFDGGKKVIAPLTQSQVDVQMAAHGVTVVEVARRDGRWTVELESPLNRRITATTPIALSGPVAGTPRVRTEADPKGRQVLGTINNCSGGLTPWGTFLVGEENFQHYFKGVLPKTDRERENHDWYGVGKEQVYKWSEHQPRFDVKAHPNEANRFGYIVEIDPKSPTSIPVKRTALGRMNHEGAATVISRSGKVVSYMGDDGDLEHLYKFVSKGRYKPGSPPGDLLDRGVLYAARFDDDGRVVWLPLVFGKGPLTPENRFHDQADVLIETRRAADLMGATSMDRPEGLSVIVETGRVYSMLTGSPARNASNVNAVNSRADGEYGQILEILEDNGDVASLTGTWTVVLKAGDPGNPATGATFSADTTTDGWFRNPDNCVIDKAGRLWVASDGNTPRTAGTTDGLYAVDLEGETRARSKLFFRVPIGAEFTGPVFTPDGETLFASVQHPGEGGSDWLEFGRESYFEDPSTRWPDFQPDTPPRPSVVVITRKGGGPIGS